MSSLFYFRDCSPKRNIDN